MNVAIDIDKWSWAQLRGTIMLGLEAQHPTDKQLVVECRSEIARRVSSRSSAQARGEA